MAGGCGCRAESGGRLSDAGRPAAGAGARSAPARRRGALPRSFPPHRAKNVSQPDRHTLTCGLRLYTAPSPPSSRKLGLQTWREGRDTCTTHPPQQSTVRHEVSLSLARPGLVPQQCLQTRVRAHTTWVEPRHAEVLQEVGRHLGRGTRALASMAWQVLKAVQGGAGESEAGRGWLDGCVLRSHQVRSRSIDN